MPFFFTAESNITNRVYSNKLGIEIEDLYFSEQYFKVEIVLMDLKMVTDGLEWCRLL